MTDETTRSGGIGRYVLTALIAGVLALLLVAGLRVLDAINNPPAAAQVDPLTICNFSDAEALCMSGSVDFYITSATCTPEQTSLTLVVAETNTFMQAVPGVTPAQYAALIGDATVSSAFCRGTQPTVAETAIELQVDTDAANPFVQVVPFAVRGGV